MKPSPAGCCPICSSQSVMLRTLPRDTLARELESFVGDGGIHDCPLDDYELHRCARCGLEFAHPMREPDGAFYEWLTRAENYYPRDRWEWSECRQELDRHARQDDSGRACRVLDVGCGSGQFLMMLKGNPKLLGTGIDVSRASVEACLAKGLDAVQAHLADVAPSFEGRFDFITLWHVVEHVADPVLVLEQSRQMLSPQGSIYFSVPLSPPSYEADWTDPLNQPPHHLTRWTAASLQALANRLGMSLQLVLPVADPLWKRITRSLLLQAVSPFERLDRVGKLRRVVGSLLRNPQRLPLSAWHQLQHPHLDGKVQPDLVLVRLRRGDNTCA